MQHHKSREVFTAALHTLCGEGSFFSRLERVNSLLNELHPVSELPSLILSDYYRLKLYIERVISPEVTEGVAEFRKPNRLEQSLVIEHFVSLFKRVVENAHDEQLAKLLRQIDEMHKAELAEQ